MSSTVQEAARLRAAFKSRGWGPKRVSVRSDCYSMGSTIRIVVRDPDVPLRELLTIAESAERVDRDQWGEILSGCNRFVDVQMTQQCADGKAARWLPQVEAAAARLSAHDRNRLERVGDSQYRVGLGEHGFGYTLWHGHDGFLVQRDSLRSIAVELAVHAEGQPPAS